MFTIYGGKTEFNQWDQGQRVTNPNMVVGDKVRFWNATGETHPMIAYMHEGVVVADVPNDLLQNACPIVVELCGKPECQGRFTVNFVSDKKPDGYIFIDNTHCEPVTPSGSGGVSSWNDLTDKPFYKEQETILDGTFEFVGTNGLYIGQIKDGNFNLENGKSYTVIWDGEAYQCVATTIEGATAIGNLGIVGQADTGEPFYVVTIGENRVFGTLDTAATHTIKVCTETIHTIDPEFLPAKGTFVVNLFHSYENGTWTSDKTAEEIVKAVRQGEAVQCVETNDDGIHGAIWQLQSVNDYIDISSMMPEYTPYYEATFNRFEVFEGNCRCQYLSINHDGTIYASKWKTFFIEDE